MQDDVTVVGHDGPSVDRDREALGQLKNSCLDPLPAMLEALSGELIFAAEKGATDTTRYNVVITGRILGHQMTAWIGHGGKIVPGWSCYAHRKIARFQAGNCRLRAKIQDIYGRLPVVKRVFKVFRFLWRNHLCPSSKGPSSLTCCDESMVC